MKFIFTLFINSFLFLSVFSQHKLYTYQEDYYAKFESLTEKDGIPGEEVYDIVQDAVGFIWLATDNGLCRYDGYRFIVFQNHLNDSTSLSNNIVTCLALDEENNLWIGTKSGMNLYDRKRGSFLRFHKDNNDLNSLNDNHIMDVFVDSENLLWIETAGGVLHRYDQKEKLFKKYKHTKPHQTYYRYHDIYEDKEGYIWIGGRGISVLVFDKISETFLSFEADPNDAEKKRDNDVASYLEDSDLNFWISGTDGIYHMDRNKGKFKKVMRGSTYTMIEDREGNIWLGSSIGLLKKERGKAKLINYRKNQDNPHSLLDNNINKLYEDRSGIIWIATDKGVSKYSPRKNMFGNYRHLSNKDNTLSGNTITAILEDHQGQVWIGTKSNGLNKLNSETGAITHYKSSGNLKNGLSSNRISALYADKSGDIWIGLWAGIGFNKLNPLNNTFTHYVYDAASFKRDWYNDFLETKTGDFYCGFWGCAGLMEFDRKNEKFTGLHFNNFNRPQTKSINTLVYLNGTVYFGTDYPVLYSYDLMKEKFRAFFVKQKNTGNNSSVNHLLLGESIYKIKQNFKRINDSYTDGIGRLFLGSDNGVIIYDSKTKKFDNLLLNKEINFFYELGTDSVAIVCKHEVYLYNLSSNNLDSNPIKLQASPKALVKSGNYLYIIFNDFIGKYDLLQKSMVEEFHLNAPFKDIRFQCALDYADTKFILGTNRGVCFFDIEKGSIAEFFDKSFSDSKNWFSVSTLYKDQLGIIWLGTDIGLGKMNLQDNTIQWLRESIPAIDIYIKGSINDITEDDDQNLWIATEESACIYNKKMNKIQKLSEKGEYGLRSRLINKLFEDSKGNIWVGYSDNGLDVMLPNGKFLHYPGDKYDVSGFRGTDINTIYQDRKQNIWVGGNKGLNKFESVNGRIKNFGIKDGFPHQEIMSIQEDDQQNLWISTGNGICKFGLSSENIISVYKQEDGLQDSRFTRASCKLSSGLLLFGGNNGASVINPEEIIDVKSISEIAFTAVNRYNELITNEINSGDTIVIKPDTKFFSVEFAALDYTDPLKNQYRYKLVGSFDNWINLGNEHKVSFTNLSPGRYLLQISASISEGVWNEEGVSLVLIVKPPFWKTKWFIGLNALLVISIISTILILKINSLKNERKSLKLEQRLLRAQMNPHFIFNVLAAVQGLIYKKETKTVSIYLSKFASLMRSILYHSGEENIMLTDEIEFVENYLKLQQLRFSGKFNYEIKIDDTVDAESVLIPPMLLQPFIENSIEHGFRKLQDGNGMIVISFNRKNSSLEIKIEDNGVGYLKANKEKSDKKHKSLGIETTVDRIKRINKGGKLQEYYNHTDLSTTGKQSGTRIIFKLPYKESY